MTEGKDNRDLLALGTQLLTADDIKRVKDEEGGEALVSKLVANSATFAKKTEFSQARRRAGGPRRCCCC